MPSALSGRSRLSGAQVQATQDAGANSEWIEPPLEQAKPSYEDHGGQAFGVLEDMLPLGARPTSKIKARAGSRKTVLGKSAVSTSDAQDTPETTPAVDDPAAIAAAEAHPEAHPEGTLPLVVFDDEKDQDYTPRLSKKASKSRMSKSISKVVSSPASTPAPPSASVEPPIAALTASHKSNGASGKASKRAPRQSTASSSSVNNNNNNNNNNSNNNSSNPPPPSVSNGKIANLDVIVESAVRRSREVGNPFLGLAIREFHQKALHDDSLMLLLGVILDQSATNEQAKVFREHISRAKKRIKAEADSIRKSRKSPARSSPPTSSRKAAQQSDQVPRQSIETTANLPRPKISIRVNHARKNLPSNKPNVKVNGTITAPITRTRSDSCDSLSSLSSLTSIEEDAMDIDDQGNMTNQATRHGDTDGFLDIDVESHTNDVSLASPSVDISRKRPSTDVDIDDKDDTILAAKKQKLSETIAREPPGKLSFVREQDRPHVQGHSDVANPIMPFVRLTADGTVRRGQQMRGGSLDIGSPLSEISSPPSTRRGTPQTATASAKTIKKKAKTKQSPTKKQLGNHGIELNGSGGRESPIGYDDNEESDNNDFCSACRGSGFLLCCDGCDRSFHFACLDPPLTQGASELDEPWFCFKCVARRAQPQKHHRGLFSALLINLDKRNPSIFNLPQDIRDHFEGVATGKDGRFVEAVNSKTRSRAGYDELPDHYKTKDAKGQSILCYQCNKSSAGRREIITCDQCNAHWHLDCLDPPRASAPYRDQWGKKVRDWLCPLHVEHELREMDVTRLADRQLEKARKLYLRKPRNAKVMDTSLSRGHVNEGIIEVINDESEPESDFFEDDKEGIVYRLPEKGIKLDFIDRVNQTKARCGHDGHESSSPEKRARTEPAPSPLSRHEFVRRSFLEQQTAVSLVQFANQDHDFQISGDQVENLLGALITEAPPEVAAQMMKDADKASSSCSAKDTEQQRKDLEALQALISKKLEELGNSNKESVQE